MWADRDVTTRLATFLICTTCGSLCDIVKQELQDPHTWPFELQLLVDQIPKERRVITRCRSCGRVEMIF